MAEYDRSESSAGDAHRDASPLSTGERGRGEPASRDWSLIEKLLTSAQDEQRRARRWGIFFKCLGFAYLFLLLWLMFGSSGSHTVPETEDHVAVVDVSGVILPDGDVEAENILSGIKDAFEAEHAKAVILQINSPGGSPVQSGIVYDEVRRLRAEHPAKKVYAVIGDVGASGAYYIAASADAIYVDKASIVGSIGVIMNAFGAEELIRKIGVESRVLTAGENKNLLDPFAPLREDQKLHLQSLLDTIHAQFIVAVKQGRGDKLKAAEHPEIFSGLFWTGEQAVALGLADAFGSTKSVARDVVGVERTVDYSYQASPLEKLAERFGAQVGESLAMRLTVEQSVPQVR